MPAGRGVTDRRRRARLLAIALVAAILGAASKRTTGPLREVAVGQLEDFFGTLFLILVPRAALLHVAFWKVAAPVLAIVTAIEISQRFDGPWLTRARGTWIGLHVLGATFEWADLLAYALAGGAAFLVDRALAPGAR
ncbi:MAG: DUF2809 domain-containing protein [Byssovorax sp.]